MRFVHLLRPLALLATVMLIGCAGDTAPSSFGSTFAYNDALTCYLVNPDGKAFSLKVTGKASLSRPFLVRIFDPEEHLLGRHYFQGDEGKGQPVPVELAVDVPAKGPGVYQVVVTGFGGTIDLTTTPELSFGVYGHTQWLAGSKNQFANAYVYLPPKLDKWKITCPDTLQELTLVDDAGKTRLTLTGKGQSGTADLPADGGEHIWQLKATSAGDYKLDFDAQPFILCPDKATAQAIKGSIDVMPDGTICFHKCQVRAWQLLQQYKGRPAEEYAVPLPDLKQHQDAWLKDPVRNSLLFGGYGAYSNLPIALKEQNLDPKSPWFGTTFIWHDDKGVAKTNNPYADYRRQGITNFAPWIPPLAAAYAIDEPFNPLHNNEALLKRLILSGLVSIMALKENENLIPESTNYYGGGRAFTYNDVTASFPLYIRACPEAERAVITEGFQRMTDRLMLAAVATCNQWAFLIRGFAHIASGADDPFYMEMTKRQIGWLYNRTLWGTGQAPAGYHSESGPDPSYNGHTCSHLAYAYHVTQDPVALESVRKAYELFNHTMAPEPDGTWLGALSFATRTPWTWVGPQGDTGFGMLADLLPEAGMRAGKGFLFPQPATTEAEMAKAVAFLTPRLNYASDDFTKRKEDWGRIQGSSGAFEIYQYFSKKPLAGALPMVDDKPFARNFGDEFFCVRRPSYYVGVYAGQGKPKWQGDVKDPSAQFPRTAGIFMFWTKDFGASLLGKNYSTYSAHTLVATRPGNLTDWEEYWSVKPTFDAEAGRLTVTGQLRNLPLTFTRVYDFADDRVQMTLTLKATAAVELTSLSECFPYPIDKEKPDPLQVTAVKDGQAISFSNTAATAHLLVFDAPRACDIGTHRSIDHYKGEHTYGRVLTALPTKWDAGQERTFRSALLPCPRAELDARVAAVVASFK